MKDEAVAEEEMAPEYDFTGAVQGNHHKAYWASRGLIPLDDDLRTRFADAEAVNRALRVYLALRDECVEPS